jgi:DNA-binding CsgD family transcriptional regulator
MKMWLPKLVSSLTCVILVTYLCDYSVSSLTVAFNSLMLPPNPCGEYDLKLSLRLSRRDSSLHWRSTCLRGRTAPALVRFLKPHIKAALHSHLAASRNPSANLQSTLDSLALGVILLSPKGQVVTMNRAAERLLAKGGGLRASREGLLAERAEESARLKQLVAEATAASARAGLEPAGVLTVSRRNHFPLQLLVSPARGFDLDEKHPVRAIVFAGDSAQRVGPTHDTLRVLFGLTPAECRLAMLLADGHSPTAIAEKGGVSRNTLKSQLSSIYGKTGTSRQAQLVRLLLQLPATSPSSES